MAPTALIHVNEQFSTTPFCPAGHRVESTLSVDRDLIP
jgi:hypothetical protein